MIIGIYYSNDSNISKYDYWQVYNPFTREYENDFFKKYVKKRNIVYLTKIIPDKEFIENIEIIPSTELVVCRLRIQKILNDKAKSNTDKAQEIINILKSYPISSILFSSMTNNNNDEYLMNEFIENMQILIKGLDKSLYKKIFTEKTAILSIIKYNIDKKNNMEEL